MPPTRPDLCLPMRAHWRWLLTVMLLASGVLAGVVWQPAIVRAAPPSRSGELVVIPRAGAYATSVAQGLEQRHGTDLVVDHVGLSGQVMVVRVPPGREDEVRAQLAADPQVAAVARNYLVQANAAPGIPNDPQYNQQWALPAIHAPEAWGNGARATGITVAVIDTGADYGHPDLANVLLPGCNYVGNMQPTGPICGPTVANDDHGHGTHVAGIIAAQANNGIGISGLAWGTRILPLKVLDSNGIGAWSEVADALHYAANQSGVRVINLSLGSDPYFSPMSGELRVLQAGIDAARSKGIVVVAAAGNDGVNLDRTPVYPAALPGVIAVAATAQGNTRASWSNYGSVIALAAPGVGIRSTFCAYNRAARACGHDYTALSGTSMAAPHVAALAALVLTRYPGLNPDGVRETMQAHATDLGTAGRDQMFGAGLINVAATLGELRLSLSSTGAGSINATPFGSFQPANTVVQLTAVPNQDAVFLNWTIDGKNRGWATTCSLTMTADRTIAANFTQVPAFTDLPAGPTGNALRQLSGRSVLLGYGDGRVGAADPVERAQVAALLVRAMGWSGEQHTNPFIDRGWVGNDLWNAVATLAYYRVAQGFGDGTYQPTAPLSEIQALSLITRAMVTRGLWQPATVDTGIYPNIAANSPHRGDLLTFVANAGPVPDRPTSVNWNDWGSTATRGWFALVLWQGLNATFGQSCH